MGLDKAQYDKHSQHQTKASLKYANTKNFRAIQLLRGHDKLAKKIEYLSVEIEDALRVSDSCDT
ncbi:integrase [Photobacterium sp. CAIM 1937]|nr:integrase [Photobacterium lucens]MZG80368.1 integrase [Photobacterium lucens]